MSARTGLTEELLKKLSAPFDDVTLAIKAQSLNANKDRVMLVPYVPHVDIYRRIESVDPGWSSEVTAQTIVGEITFARVKLTICGVSRENAGDGDDLKSAVSDAHKRAAMLFGIARYLYDAEGAWVPYNREEDRYRVWTVAEYQDALKRRHLPSLPMAASSNAPAPAGPIRPAAPPQKPFKDLEAEAFRLAKDLRWTRDDLFKFAEDQLGKDPTKMIRADLENLVDLMRKEIRK
jgi:hypothetical protein